MQRSAFEVSPHLAACGQIIDGLCNGDELARQTCRSLGVPAHQILEVYATWLEGRPDGDFPTFISEANGSLAHIVRKRPRTLDS